MKKLLLSLALLAIAFSSLVLVSCGNDDKNDDPQPQNQAPTISITNPGTLGYTLSKGKTDSTITIKANAVDPDGTISKVEFYINSSKIGEDLTSPYTQDYTFSGDIEYTIKVTATDNKGLSTSKEINVMPVGLP